MESMMETARVRRLDEHRLEISIFLVFLGIYLLFLVGNFGVFSRVDIYYSFMSTIPFSGILALAMTLVVTLGEIDLSFPSVLAFSAWIFGKVLEITGDVWLATLACLATGVLSGLLNSLLIVRIGIPSLVATLGTQFFFRGMVNVCAQGQGIPLVKAANTLLFQLFVGRLFGVIPAQAIWFAVLAIVFSLVLKHHRFGSHVLLVGDNKESARMMGINVDGVKTWAFVQMGFFAAFAGILSTLEVTYFWPSQGQGFLLTTLAAVFIGGTSVFGGMGTIFGSFIGALIIGSLEAGIVAIGLTGFWVQAIYGTIILIAVSIYALLLRKRS